MEHAFSFILCGELVMTVNIPVQERNATCTIVASVGSLHDALVLKFHLKLSMLPIKMAE